MYINLREKLHIHLFGMSAYIYSQNENDTLILLDEVETFFIDNLMIENDYEPLIKNINTSIDDIELTKNTVNKILNKFNNLFYLDIKENDLKSQITLTGEKGCYYPLSIEISLTNQCKHKCIHCYKGYTDKEDVLDYEYIKKTLGYLKNKTKFIQLTGGEPLLHKDVVQLINEYSEDFDITITSSGYVLIEELLECLKKVKFIQISQYSCDASKHNRFVNIKDSFDVIKKNILRMKDHDIEVRISTLITQDNMGDLEKLIKYCIDMQIKNISVGTVSNVGRALGNQRLFLNENQFKTIKNELNELHEKYKSEIEILQWEEVDNHVCKNVFNCHAGKLKWHIKEDGDIIPCSLFDIKHFIMGNIKNGDHITLIENSEHLNNFNDIWKKNSKDIEIEYKNRGTKIHEICKNVNLNSENLHLGGKKI